MRSILPLTFKKWPFSPRVLDMHTLRSVWLVLILLRYIQLNPHFFVALYGKPYIQAAKDTWALFRDRGIDALVNDSLVGTSKSTPLYSTSQAHRCDLSSHMGGVCCWDVMFVILISVSEV